MSESDIPCEISELADEALSDVLPEKSRKIYELTYTTFVNWKTSKSLKETNETILLAYFKIFSEKYKPTTLWSIFSQLKSMIQIKEKINVDNSVEVTAFLKKKSRGYIPKKSKVFSPEEVETFLKTAPDDHHLCDKVIMIFGIFGALRSDELIRVKVEDVQRQGEIYYVKVPVTKNMKPRSFTITDEFCSYAEKYAKLRPKNVQNDRFFLNFQKGKCTVQVIGKNKFTAIPQKIAEYLKLPNAKEYTGHSFRRTSATIFVDAGADITTLKRHGGWKSSTVAEGYIEESLAKKNEISSLFSKAIDVPSTSGPKNDFENIISPKRLKSNPESDDSESLTNKFLQEKHLNFQNCNITINFQ